MAFTSLFRTPSASYRIVRDPAVYIPEPSSVGYLSELKPLQITLRLHVAAILSRVNAPWAKSRRKRLQDAIRQAEIKCPARADEVSRQDREKILLNLPEDTVEAIRDRLREIRLVEQDTYWLVPSIRAAAGTHAL